MGKMWAKYPPWTPEEKKRIRRGHKQFFLDFLPYVLKAAQGDVFDPEFLNLLPDHIPPSLQRAQLTRWEMKELLEQAWWIEEEDMRQHLLMCIWQHKITSKANLSFLFRCHLRDYLLSQKCFVRQLFNEDMWVEHWFALKKNAVQDDNEGFLNQTLKITNQSTDMLSKFETYLLYLMELCRELELSKVDTVSDVCMQHKRQVFRWLAKLEEKVETYNVQA